MAENSENSNIEGGRVIGAKKFTPLKGVEVRKPGGVVVPKVSARPSGAAAPAARNESLGPSLRAAPKKVAAPKKPVAVLVEEGDGGGGGGGGGGVAPKKAVRFAASALAEEAAPVEEGPKLVVTEVGAETEAVVAGAQETATEAAAAASALSAFKQRLAGIGGRIDAAPPSADAPIMDEKAFKADAALKAALGAKPVREMIPAGESYVPVTSSTFQDFMVQTYSRYTPFFADMVAAAKAADGKGPPPVAREIDKDACKRRDPDKVETFYYQKIVRDYLNKATPYRGLLVYHGLGTGKTCTSIAAAEALYWGGQRKIFVLTPATLSNNYRRELGKCGYFPLRTNNDWAFLPYDSAAPSPSVKFYLVEVMGLPEQLITKQGGAWIPNPNKPSNWRTLSADVQASIHNQMNVHLNHRFKFIHYNGVSPSAIAALAEQGLGAGESVFDNAVVIIDEIHNLVRTVNGTEIGSIKLADFIQKVEPNEPTWSMRLRRERPGYKYPRGYTLYRLLMNAVGAKIIALSATPMINYAQEFGILMNMVGGEQRMAEISLKTMARDPATLAKLEAWCRAPERGDLDFFSIEESTVSRDMILTVTPVPYGYSKVVGADFATRGFVRVPDRVAGPVSASRERNMMGWAASLVRALVAEGILPAVTGAEVDAAVAARAESKNVAIKVKPLIYDNPKDFLPAFINRANLEIMNGKILEGRATGLISFYRGGSEELMPRTSRNEVVRVPMSDYMFQLYTRMRLAELEMESPPEAKEGEEGAAIAKKSKKGVTAAEDDLYAQATKSISTGFLTWSRAACNWVFPEGIERPVMNAKQQAKLLGIEPDRTIAVDKAEDEDADLDYAVGGVASAGGGGAGRKATAAVEGEEGEEADAAAQAVVLEDEAGAAPVTEKPLDATLASIVGDLMSKLEAEAGPFLHDSLATYSPKYAEILTRIRASAGPALVYSQFKTLEGLGIFAAALRAADEQYLPLEIVKGADGEWEIPAAIMDPSVRERPRYIMYTGDQPLEKRRILLQLYNADLPNLPAKLSAQCAELMGAEPDNRTGRICKVFMITQSGAEGISLFNTRQVHIMEPYWNNVRLQQVIGRAIRLCSHMNLPWDDRTVDVFTYLSVFTEEQKTTGSKPLMMADKGKTTDETIFEIATAKQKLADGLFAVAQASAMDCQVHYFEHGARTECFKYPPGARPLFVYHPDIERDLVAAGFSPAAGGK